MKKEQIIIIGAGPCGLSAGLALKEKGFDPLVIEKENVAHSIYRYPAHQTFFSSSDKLEIGGYPFPSIERKPKRHEALVYYRTVADRSELRIHSYEKVVKVSPEEQTFLLETVTKTQERKQYRAKYVIVATGYYDHPNMMGIEGEELPHVFHYFKEAHPYYNQNVTVIGGKNSAVDAALALEQAGAHVTVIYRGDRFSEAVKPWILPDFHSLVRRDKITMHFNANVTKITKTHVYFEKEGTSYHIPADFVFAMTGYHPDHSFLQKIGVDMDEETGRPTYDEETMESNVDGLFIAGVIAAGNDANEIFIENGRFHGDKIVQAIIKKERNRDA
ncbi:YpdA family putative bacillithiol disulfide reductase [Aliibacillus thermotolerans]|uniref:YpdA family putative bacillithiol disulfide reductase n=1 Tax=Aliibacillus thermotolerans TaxID=1834418 RepID=A0ABW0U504_9BACI|nr:YpdA family putative bacillithiol disulfide reductase [Aliibacillus thermotolerans]MDA3129483.1 YpdA family putative bacillithiol disulfide reductase [Aliibacillus thermotolerans]